MGVRKIPVSKLFLNNNIGWGYRRLINFYSLWAILISLKDMVSGINPYERRPIETVDVSWITPTQRFLSKENLERISGIKLGGNTGAFLVEYNDIYYIIDGHHRIANQIIIGSDKVKAYVHHLKK